MVRGALARVESKEYKDALARFSKDYYVIAVIHMTMGVGQEGLSSQWSREQEEAMQNPSTTQVGQGGARMAQTDNLEARRVFTSSRLLIPGGEAVSPVRVESGRNAEGTVSLLMFPRNLASDKNYGYVDLKTTFWVGMGFSTVKVKFNLKDMGEGVEQGL